MPLIESRAPGDPLILFRRWFREAQRRGSPQPDAITLATADARGAPSARMVLFKGIIRLPATRGALPPHPVGRVAPLAQRAQPGGEIRASNSEGFVFYSNYDSRKGRDLAANNRAALVFYWPDTRHQVRVSGRVSRLPRAASVAYFH